MSNKKKDRRYSITGKELCEMIDSLELTDIRQISLATSGEKFPFKIDGLIINNRFVCTKGFPWDKTQGKAYHPDSTYISSNDSHWKDCSTDTYECANCGLIYSVYVAE